MCGREGDAKLHRHQRHAALEYRAPGIEFRCRATPRLVVGAALQFTDEPVNDVVLDDHSIGRHVSWRISIEVDPPDLQGIKFEVSCDVVHYTFDCEHALRAAKAAERGVRSMICLAAMRDDLHIRHVVAVIAVKHRANVDRVRQIGGTSAVGRQYELQADEPTCVVKAHLIGDLKRVPFAGDQHVDIAIEAQLDGQAGLPGAERCNAGDQRGLGLLAAKPTAHSPASDHDVVRAQIEGPCNEPLNLADVLGRAMHMHCSIFARQRERDLPLEIEMILTAE